MITDMMVDVFEFRVHRKDGYVYEDVMCPACGRILECKVKRNVQYCAHCNMYYRIDPETHIMTICPEAEANSIIKGAEKPPYRKMRTGRLASKRPAA